MNQDNEISTNSLLSFGKLVLLSLIFAAISGCSTGNMSDLNKFIADTKAKYMGQVEALPAITPYETHRYQVSHQRDPFKASVSLVKTITKQKSRSNGIKPNSVRNKEELEKYALETLIMVGVMNNDGQNWAIIKAPDNSIFRVRNGNYMGENNGKIIRITESLIELKEIVADGQGGWLERPNKLTLSK